MVESLTAGRPSRPERSQLWSGIPLPPTQRTWLFDVAVGPLGAGALEPVQLAAIGAHSLPNGEHPRTLMTNRFILLTAVPAHYPSVRQGERPGTLPDDRSKAVPRIVPGSHRGPCQTECRGQEAIPRCN